MPECAYCKTKLELKPYQIKKNHRNIFCNSICYGKFQRNRVQKVCEICGRKFEIKQSLISVGGGRTCSRKCHYIYQSIRPQISGELHHCWQGGITTNVKGYVLIISPNHPNKDKNGHVFEHRLVIERHLGRYLLPSEQVHHVDKNVKNNELKNLMLFQDGSAHQLFEHNNLQDLSKILFDGRNL